MFKGTQNLLAAINLNSQGQRSKVKFKCDHFTCRLLYARTLLRKIASKSDK